MGDKYKLSITWQQEACLGSLVQGGEKSQQRQWLPGPSLQILGKKLRQDWWHKRQVCQWRCRRDTREKQTERDTQGGPGLHPRLKGEGVAGKERRERNWAWCCFSRSLYPVGGCSLTTWPWGRWSELGLSLGSALPQTRLEKGDPTISHTMSMFWVSKGL